MKHGSLFSGIGSFDYAAQQMGWENIFHCEWNPFGQRVLKYYWPKAISHGDITQTDFNVYRGRIDVLTGGFPCQDASVAQSNGNGQVGLNGSRTGLWTHMVRAIEETKPKYVIAENVENIFRTNDGRDFREILNCLARMGYNAEWRTCRASEVGAPHQRARMYLVAYPNSIRLQENESFYSYVVEQIPQKRRHIAGTTASVGISWPSEPSISFMDDGIREKLDGITFSKWMQESIKAAGNAAIYQIPLAIFKAISEYEETTRMNTY